jgi:cytoskeleton protein RodZ
VGSFGERLRREREMRGIGLDEIAAATKISTRNLRALEEEKFKQLPGGIFNKGFVRAYAKFLGIDQDQIVAEYEAASQDTESARENKLKEDFANAEFRKQKKEDDQEISLEPKSQWGTIAVIVLIAAIGYGGYSYYQRRKADKLQQAQTPTSVAVQPAPQTQPPVTPPITATNDAATTPTGSTAAPGTSITPATTTTTTPPADTTKPDSAKPPQTSPDTAKPASQKTEMPAANTNPKSGTEQKSPTTEPKPATTAGPPFELKIKVNKQSWVSIKADGKTLVNGTLEPGTERTFKASEKIDVILGNAGGVEVSYNGKPVENLNTGQDVRKLTFTPSGYE